MERALDWDDGAIVAVDQTALPARLELLRLATVDDVVDAIRRLVVRGAPVIGITGALGVALAARHHVDPDGRVDEDAVRRDAQRIVDSRPTAVNLRWAVDRVLTRLSDGPDAVLAEALAVLAEEEQANRVAARRAADVLRAQCPDRPLRVLTHCNTGTLATMGGGTALGAIRALARDGRLEEVIATETRPFLQGARLTVWELHQDGLPPPALRRLGRTRRDGRRAGRRRRRRRGPHRRERRHREQDRHLRAGLRRGPQPDPVRRGRAAEHRRSRDTRRRRHPDRGARRRRGRPAGRNGHHRPRHAGLQPGVRRDTGAS